MPIKKRGVSAEVTPDAADSPFDPLGRGDLPQFKRQRMYTTGNVEVTGDSPTGKHEHGDNTQMDPRDEIILIVKTLIKLYDAVVKHPKDQHALNAYIVYVRKLVARNDDIAVSVFGAGVSALSVLDSKGLL